MTSRKQESFENSLLVKSKMVNSGSKCLFWPFAFVSLLKDSHMGLQSMSGTPASPSIAVAVLLRRHSSSTLTDAQRQRFIPTIVSRWLRCWRCDNVQHSGCTTVLLIPSTAAFQSSSHQISAAHSYEKWTSWRQCWEITTSRSHASQRSGWISGYQCLHTAL